MKISFIAITDNKDALAFKSEYRMIAKRAQKSLNTSKDYCCSVIFVEDDEIQRINRQYRNLDSITDVISFALKDERDNYPINSEIACNLGDIFINIQAIQKQADEYRHSYKREALFLFTHGLLHLLGYDHQEKSQEIAMFNLQKELLSELYKEI